MERKTPIDTSSLEADTPVNVKALGLAGLEDLAGALGQPAYRGRQLFQWLYGKGARSFEAMSNLPKAFRKTLADVAEIDTITQSQLQTARDETAKGLFTLSSGRQIEAVLIPDFDDEGAAKRLTVCVSSQVGCALGCSFCATGLMGFQQNLTAGEIFDQVWLINALAQQRYGRGVTNVVFMGMGEPMLNYDNVLRSITLLTEGLGLSPRRITVSTVGLARRIKQLADDQPRVNLAVSLHAPTDAKRSSIMPVNRAVATDLAALKASIEYYTRATGRRITYEYCMFRGFNDTAEDAHHLADVVAWAPSKVNLIMYNPVEGLGFEPTPEAHLNAFIRILVHRGVTVTVRRSRGQDIDAACGQLAIKGRSGKD